MGGMQITLENTDADTSKDIRRKIEEWDMYVEGSVALQTTNLKSRLSKIRSGAFKDAGATVLRAAMTGRRYEVYKTLDDFKKEFAQCQKAVELAEPILRKYRMQLAVENHKGWRSAEQIAWIKRVGSEYVGVCFDVGNNLSLCEDPMELCEAFAPMTFAGTLQGHGPGGIR